jgi:hypothetical protein
VIVGRDVGQLNGKLLATAAVAWLALGGALLAIAADAHGGVVVGWGLAGLLSALSLGSLIWVRRRSLRDVMLVVFGGFLGRMIAVGVTLVVLIRANTDPLRFTLGFFSAYLLLQVIEVIWLDAQAKLTHGKVSA